MEPRGVLSYFSVDLEQDTYDAGFLIQVLASLAVQGLTWDRLVVFNRLMASLRGWIAKQAIESLKRFGLAVLLKFRHPRLDCGRPVLRICGSCRLNGGRCTVAVLFFDEFDFSLHVCRFQMLRGMSALNYRE